MTTPLTISAAMFVTIATILRGERYGTRQAAIYAATWPLILAGLVVSFAVFTWKEKKP